ncbi:hypothetical protein NQ317_015204 [Molorchus minor]|uniref:Uncharacterized protein n=1 Tax=Molorchus minor TaxID=1323400 RepID=A0ABQ9JCF4_9CUCU|nr:hypothetical protein NQ317_015204 [Molorchus minor]
MRPDYKEPVKPPTNLLEAGDQTKSFAERIKELDCYIGFTDGYAYRSWDRLSRMKKKYVIKPDLVRCIDVQAHVLWTTDGGSVC